MMRNTFVGLMAVVVLLVASHAMALNGTYVDATASNVTAVNGIASGWVNDDNKWGACAYTGYGIGDTWYMATNSKPNASEDAGELTMTVSGLAQGEYEIGLVLCHIDYC